MSNYNYTIGEKVDLKKEQEATLSSPRLKANLILKILFVSLDLLYGKKRTLKKFRVLEMLARFPYIAWENQGYKNITSDYVSQRTAKNLGKLDADLGVIELGRSAQDNEQFHLFLINDALDQQNIKLGWFRYSFLSTMAALSYSIITTILYKISPKTAYFMNAAFEDHAEYEYMLMAKENPEWETLKFDSKYYKYYPKQDTLADLVRRIGLDERDHKFESLEAAENC